MTSDHSWDSDRFRDRIEATLQEFIDAQEAELATLGAPAHALLEQARVSVSGGKRLRAAFCWWGHRAAGAEVADDDAGLLRAGAALELLHASALVHDDYMDSSDTRRGRAATHRHFAQQLETDGWPGDPVQYGAAGAILLGDLLLSWSDELLRTSGLPAREVLDALGYLDRTRSEVVLGQFLDVSAQAEGVSDVERAMQVLRYKSAKYSIERPLNIGAALAGAEPETQQALSAFGLPLGEAFQLRDDLLGVFGDPEVTGKPAGDDLVEGKRTVLVAHALAMASGADAFRLDVSLGTPLNAIQITDLQQVIDRCGARSRVEETIDALTDQCLRALESDRIAEAAKPALRQLAEAATQRVL